MLLLLCIMSETYSDLGDFSCHRQGWQRPWIQRMRNVGVGCVVDDTYEVPTGEHALDALSLWPDRYCVSSIDTNESQRTGKYDSYIGIRIIIHSRGVWLLLEPNGNFLILAGAVIYLETAEFDVKKNDNNEKGYFSFVLVNRWRHESQIKIYSFLRFDFGVLTFYFFPKLCWKEAVPFAHMSFLFSCTRCIIQQPNRICLPEYV